MSIWAGLKAETLINDAHSWRPGATSEALKGRARQLSFVRGFFAQRDVLEVETPVLGRCAVTDPNLNAIAAQINAAGCQGGWLQTSPEYHMKRLLAAGCGDIYQVTKVFRNGESGAKHNPEFSMLEWYRSGFDDRALMDEVADLVCSWLDCAWPDTQSYRNVIRRWANIDPFTCTHAQLKDRCREWLRPEQLADMSRDDCLDLLMGFAVEPHLGRDGPVFVHQYPASQAALARTSQVDGFAVAHRFELYINGLELCNGYWELTDAAEQRERFDADNRLRQARGQATMEPDQAFLAALGVGLPECAGVALGLDRLLMLKLGASSIDDVLTFPWPRA